MIICLAKLTSSRAVVPSMSCQQTKRLNAIYAHKGKGATRYEEGDAFPVICREMYMVERHVFFGQPTADNFIQLFFAKTTLARSPSIEPFFEHPPPLPAWPVLAS